MEQFVVADPAMQRVVALMTRLARSPIAVLLTGETGTGKEVAAHALHRWSSRASGPFIAVNAAALPENLVESELFGHRKGSFSGAIRDRAGVFESADGGTLFLDEIGELPLSAQAKLLRALDAREITPIGECHPVKVDVRVIAATNRDLLADVRAGRFREDLYFRLAAAQVALPALRDRPLDVPVLAEALLARACARAGRAPLRLGAGALAALTAQSFPGNVRELANAMEYAAAMAAGAAVEPEDLPPAAPAAPERLVEKRFSSIAEEIAELERRRMAEALRFCRGNQCRAADLIGMPRRTFVTKLGRHGLRGEALAAA